jgi:hypothetical protein
MRPPRVWDQNEVEKTTMVRANGGRPELTTLKRGTSPRVQPVSLGIARR